MKISTVIIGIALFAIVTMILYGWGIVKQKNQTSDLMNLLFSKGQDKIKKYLKKTVCVYRILFRMCNNFVRKKVC